MTNEELSDALKTVYKKAIQDEAYREKALKNPHAVIEAETNEPIPSNVKITFADGNHQFALTLPPVRDNLSEKELDSVAGGVNTTITTVTTVTIF